jgi:hypothetical protein
LIFCSVFGASPRRLVLRPGRYTLVRAIDGLDLPPQVLDVGDQQITLEMP